jgi:hypothetical protein
VGGCFAMTSSNFMPAQSSQPFSAAFVAASPVAGTARSAPLQDIGWTQDTADMLADRANIAALVRQRRRARLLRFAICEVIAIALTVGFTLAGLSSQYLDDSLTPVFRFLPIASAAAATILPILFFGDPKRRVSRARLR